jgi:DNA-binding NarL/FixJ family response regulator
MLFRQGIIELLKDNPLVEIVDEVDNGNSLIKSYFENKPDIIIIDISMPKLSGYEAFERIKARDNNVKALFLSMHTEEVYYYQIYNAGGKGLLSKNIIIGELETALISVMEGKIYFGNGYPEERLKKLVSRYREIGNESGARKIILSGREKQVLKLIGMGKTSQEIAEFLTLSKRTVDKHREIIMKKIKAKNLIELYRYAFEFIREFK